jgi:hypothetical protein
MRATRRAAWVARPSPAMTVEGDPAMTVEGDPAMTVSGIGLCQRPDRLTH